MNMNSYECLFIHDRQENVEMARSLGLNAIHFTNAGWLRAELQHTGVLHP
jgi:FMN phosphatase YigB (HAD superfamily)|tara:strand:- start:234 stop:383 length:150 start_codon:yes stop_codon:yes gene_type:complete